MLSTKKKFFVTVFLAILVLAACAEQIITVPAPVTIETVIVSKSTVTKESTASPQPTPTKTAVYIAALFSEQGWITAAPLIKAVVPNSIVAVSDNCETYLSKMAIIKFELHVIEWNESPEEILTCIEKIERIDAKYARVTPIIVFTTQVKTMVLNELGGINRPGISVLNYDDTFQLRSILKVFSD